jgi:hypothetical protein
LGIKCGKCAVTTAAKLQASIDLFPSYLTFPHLKLFYFEGNQTCTKLLIRTWSTGKFHQNKFHRKSWLAMMLIGGTQPGSLDGSETVTFQTSVVTFIYTQLLLVAGNSSLPLQVSATYHSL